MATKFIKIRTFPTKDGDTTSAPIAIADLTKEMVFEGNMTIAVGKKICASWDEVLTEVQRSMDPEPEIMRFRTIAGG